MFRLSDSHFHSQIIVEKGLSLEEALSSIALGIDIGTEYNDLPDRYELLKSHKHIALSAAMGPWETSSRDIVELEKLFGILKSNIELYKPSLIGEAGLDYYCGYGDSSIQIELFKKHLELANEKNLPIIIHNREADYDTENCIKEINPQRGGIIHCFSGSLSLMRTALDLGFYISYAGNVTYKANQSLRDTVKYVPKDRILLETDAPYLTPVPLRGRPNTPAYIINTYNCVAEIMGITADELSELTYSNLGTLIG